MISLEKRLIYRLFGSLSFSLSCSCSVSTPLSFQCRLYYHHSLFPPFAHFSNEKKVDRRAQLNDADRWRTLGGGKGSKKERVCAVRLRACVYLSGRKRKMGGRRTKRLICSIYIRDWKERGSRLLGGEEGDRYYIDWDRQADGRTDERTREINDAASRPSWTFSSFVLSISFFSLYVWVAGSKGWSSLGFSNDGNYGGPDPSSVATRIWPRRAHPNVKGLKRRLVHHWHWQRGEMGLHPRLGEKEGGQHWAEPLHDDGRPFCLPLSAC